MAYQSFEDLEVWQRGCRLSVSIFQTLNDVRNTRLKIKLSALVSRFHRILQKGQNEVAAMLEGLRRSVLARTRAKQKRASRRRNHLKLNT
jgi:hypothetical protein